MTDKETMDDIAKFDKTCVYCGGAVINARCFVCGRETLLSRYAKKNKEE